jgi:pyruvate kinase
MYISNIKDARRLVQASENRLIGKNLVKEGDLIVLVSGMGLKQGSTNMIKIHRVGHED